MTVVDLPIGSNPSAPIRAHVVEPIVANEHGAVLVFHDTNGAPMFRFALNPLTGKFTFSPLTIDIDLDMAPLMTIARAGVGG